MKTLKKVLVFMFAAIFVVALGVGATTKNENTRNIALTVQAAEMVGIMAGRKAGSKYAQVYNQLREKYQTSVISEDIIRVELDLENGVSEYVFPLNKATGQKGLERKLAEQDGFRIVDIGAYLLADDKTIPGIGVLQTYPNAIVFPSEVGGLQTNHLEMVYNGHFGFKIGDTTYTKSLPLQGCRVVRTAQQTSATNQSERLSDDGLISFTPQFTIRGFENNEFKITVPGNANHKVQALAASTFKVKLVLILKGYTVSGAGTIKSSLSTV